MNYIKTDILVIGSGAAGLSASVYAAETGLDVLVLDKGAFGKSGSTVGAVQIAGLGPWSDPRDNPEAYASDIEKSGRGLSRPDLIETLTSSIEARLNDLFDMGLKLDKNQDKAIDVTLTSGHTIPRSISSKKGKSGLSLLQTLIKAARRYDNINRWSDIITLEILTHDNEARGAVVYSLRENMTYIIQSKAVILATGGVGQLFSITSNPVQSTGDGFSLGLHAGASLIDMEQLQFYPVSVIKPQSLAGLCLSFYHLGKLYNQKKERFMTEYEPETLEDTTRDKLSIAIAKEVSEGRGTDHNGVWLDASEEMEAIKTYFHHEYKLLKDRGADPETTLLETGPAAHFLMGGIRINIHGATNIPGLYAAGETSGGLHGGNRLGNNALSECIVFGAEAGRAAAEQARTSALKSANDNLITDRTTLLLQQLSNPGNNQSLRPFVYKEKIRIVMDRHLGVFRTMAGLKKAQEELAAVKEQLSNVSVHRSDEYSREVIDFFEVHHMIETAQMITSAAIARKESRGAHYLAEHAEMANELYHTSTTLENGSIRTVRIPVKEGNDDYAKTIRGS